MKKIKSFGTTKQIQIYNLCDANDVRVFDSAGDNYSDIYSDIKFLICFYNVFQH